MIERMRSHRMLDGVNDRDLQADRFCRSAGNLVGRTTGCDTDHDARQTLEPRPALPALHAQGPECPP